MANEPSSPSAGDMSYSVELPSFKDVDIISFQSYNVHKVEHIKDAISTALFNGRAGIHGELEKKLKIHVSNWLEQGLDCEILRAGSSKGWEKGKIKFRVIAEFYSDEAEVQETLTNDKQKLNQLDSSLDEMRLAINKLS